MSDQYDRSDMNPESILQNAAQEARRRKDARSEAEPEKISPPEQIRKNQSSLKQAVASSKSRTRIPLYGMQKRTGRHLIRLECRRLTVQELSASNMLPKRADKLVGIILDRAMKATEQPRNRYGVTNPTAFSDDDVKQILEEEMGGMNRETAAAFFEFQAAVACVACIDEGNRLYMTEEEADADELRGVYIWELPDEDIERIFDWAFKQEEMAEESVLPFSRGGDADEPVSAVERYVSPAERSDQV